MTAKSDKPLWVQHMEGTVSQPGSDNWKTSGSTLPLRYHGGQSGYDNFSLPRAKDTGSGAKAGAKGPMSDTASLLSRDSKATIKSQKKAGRRLGLILLLLLLAFLLAVGLGALVYYLLLKDPSPSWRDRSVAESSVRILNEIYTPDMDNSTSAAFKRIAEPFCEEMDSYFGNSEYGRHYNGCHVVALRDVGERADCTCFAEGAGAVEVVYELTFRGNHGDKLSHRIPLIIEEKTRKVNIGDALHVLIKNFLVDIRILWKESYNGALADMTFPVYNLTYSNSLAFRNSTAFLSHAMLFCADIDEFLQNSWFQSRYISCEVSHFGKDPVSISIDLRFRGEDVRDLQTALIYVIMTSAPDVTVGNTTLKMIGDLLVTPYYVNQTLSPLQLTTPKPSSTTPSPWPGNGVYVREILRVININYTDSIGDPSSPDFKQLAFPFCDKLGELYGMSEHKDRYHSCKVYNFKDKPVAVVFAVVFRGTEWRGLGDSVVKVIRRFAPRVVMEGKEVYRVGPLLILLGDSDHTLGPTSIPPEVTTVQPTPTAVIVYDGVRLDTYLKLYNLTYTDDLGDPRSVTFKRHASLFCDDMSRFYSISEFSPRYYDCGVTAISPSTMLYFSLVFRGSDFRGLQESVRSVITRHARQVQLGNRLLYRVGDLLVLPSDIFVTVIPTNITMATSTVTWIVPSTLTLESSDSYDGPKARIPLRYHLYRFTHTPSLADSSSELFLSFQSALCRELTKLYSRTPVLESVYYDCRIDRYMSDPSEIIFSIIFKTRGSPALREITRRSLENQLPHINVTGSGNMVHEVMPVGGMFLLLGNMTVPPDVKTVTVLPPTQTVTIDHTADKPSLTVRPGHMTIQMTYFLYDFQYRPSLAFPTSGDFMNIQAKLCETLRMIYRRTVALGHVFESCAVNEFGSDPNTITFHVDFTSQYPDVLRDVVIETLHKSQPHVILADFELLPVSDLFFILKNYEVISTSYIMPSTSSIQPSATEVMTSSVGGTTPMPRDIVASMHVYNLFNFTMTPDLKDPTSILYLYYQARFCDDIKKQYSRNYLSSAYRHCRIDNFTNVDVADPRNNTVGFTLYFETPVYPQLQKDIINVIELSAPRRNISGYLITTFGDLHLILDMFTAKLVDPFRSTTLLWVPSSTFFDNKDSTISVTMTSSYTVTPSLPPTTTPDPRESYILSIFKYGLINFRYYPELSDPKSPMFMWYQKLFCDDIASYYRNSLMAAAYRDCRITEFSPDSQNVTFRIWFETPMFPQLQWYIINILETQAPKLNISTFTVLDVGELYLRWKNFTNKIVTPDPGITTILWTPPTTDVTVQPTPTSSAIMTSSVTTTPPPPPSWIKAIFNYGLLNFDYYPELKDPDSMLFRIYERRFCNDVASLYRNSYLAAAYRDCEIKEFSPDGHHVTFHFSFDTPMFPKLQSYILEILETAPHLKISGFHVLDVGDLYLILGNFSYIIVTPDPDVTTLTWVPPSTITPSSTPVPSSSVVMTSSVPPVPDNWLRAVFRFGLLNFDFYPELKDHQSMLFRIYQRKFCYDIQSFYSTSFLAAAYRDCAIRELSPDSKIEFEIEFETPVFPKLQGYILSVLESQAPRLNMSGHTVLDVGDLYLIWGNYSYVIVTPDPSVTTVTWVPSTTIVPTSTKQPEMSSTMTSTVTPTPPPSNDWVLAIFNYTMFDFTWMPELDDPNTLLYKLYQNKFCSDIERFYRPTYLNMAYRGCEITSFGKGSDVIEFRLLFDTPVFPSLQSDILYFLENAAPKFNISTYTVMDVGDIYLIWKNFTYFLVTPEPKITTIHWTPSTTIMPTSTQALMTSSIITTTPATTTEDPSKNWLHAIFDFRLLDFMYLNELADPSSMLYMLYQRKFCDDIRRFYGASYLFMVYKECRIREFSPDGRLRFHVAFDTRVFPNLVSDIVTTLYDGAPKRDIREFHVLDVGDLFLIWRNYSVIVIPPGEFSTSLYWTPSTSAPPATSTTIEPSMTSSVVMTSSVGTTPYPPEYVLAIFRFGLLNFQNYPDLADKGSMLYQIYQRKFCDDIRRFYSTSYLSVLLRDCQISEFGASPDTMKFVIAFETPVFKQLQSDILTVLEREAPKFNMSGYTVLEVGDLFLIWANFSYILVDPTKSSLIWVHSVTSSSISPTSTYTIESTTLTTPTTPNTTESTYQLKMSFEILNLFMTKELADVNSVEFKRRQELFCNDMSQLLIDKPQKFRDYKSCNFDVFTDDPLRVNISLHFYGQQPTEMSELVVSMIKESAPRENYLDLIGIRLGDILIAMDNFTVHIHNYSTLPPSPTTTPVAYDALLYNITFMMFPGNYTAALQDTSSGYFRQISQNFCNDIRRYFEASYLQERYYDCRIGPFSGGSSPSLEANVIISGIYDFGAPLIYDIISTSAADVTIFGRSWLRIGNILVYANNPGESILIQWDFISTTPYTVTPTPLPDSYTILDLSANIIDMTFTSDLTDPSSAAFRAYAIPFCQFLNQKFTSRKNTFPDYFGCMVNSFSNNPFSLAFSLRFRGIQEDFLSALVIDIIIEWTQAIEANRIVVGPLSLDEMSLTGTQRYITNGNEITPVTSSPRTTPFYPPSIPTPPTTTAGANPCAPGVYSFEPHPSECNKFYYCEGGTAKEMTCAQGKTFNTEYKQCIDQPPGFKCPL